MNNKTLVGEIFARRPLWDIYDENYNKRDITSELWDEVAISLNQDCAKIKKRWKNLKDNYRQELKKIKDNVITSSKWALFDIMNVIMLSSKKRHKKKKTKLRIEQFNENDDDDLMSSEEEKKKKTKRLGKDITHKSKPKANSSNSDIFSTIQAIGQGKLNDFEEKQEQEKYDADCNFLLSFIPHVKSLSEISKLKFRIEMCNILMKMKQEDEKVRADSKHDKRQMRGGSYSESDLMMQKTTLPSTQHPPPSPSSSTQLEQQLVLKQKDFSDNEALAEFKYNNLIIKSESEMDMETIEISYDNLYENTVEIDQ